MLGTLLHGGDLSGGDWLFLLVIVALIGAAILAAFVGVIYLISKRWPSPKPRAAASDE